MYIFADKTRNLYEATPDQYDKILKYNITKSYKLGETNMLNNVNEDLRDIAIDLSIDNRIETMAKREAFVTAKDHKENFEDNPKFRLINPAKSELGKVSKIILDEINNNIRERTGVNQWRNSQSVIDWFKTINDKPNHIFISFDIAEFYPSITEELLDKAICWARTITPITDQQEKIIKHARTSFLLSNNDTWIKQNFKSLFDVTMGSYDGAEICDLVGLYMLNVLTNEFEKERVGLYRDDGLVLIKGKSERIADKVRKKLHTLFE